MITQETGETITEKSSGFPKARPFYFETSQDGVFALALCYLAAPCLIFLVTFIRPTLGWPLALALGALVYEILSRQRWDWKPALFLPSAILAVAMTILVGIPTSHTPYDWVKHWAMLNELANNTWPVKLNLGGQPSYMRYYLAAYLVPALAHKALHPIPIAACATVCFGAGYLLVFRTASIPYNRRSRGTAMLAGVVPFFLVGADIYSQHVLAPEGARFPQWLGFHYGFWNKPMGFDSAFSGLAFAPHQTIAILLVTAGILWDRGKGSLPRTIVAYGLLAFWSPYGMIGLLPLMLLRVTENLREAQQGISLKAAAIGISFSVLVAFYLSTDIPLNGMCATCLVQHLQSEKLLIAIFLVVELPVYLVVLGQRLLDDRYCIVALGSVMFIPLLHGHTSDFVGRGAVGPLFVLALRGTERLLDFKTSRHRLAQIVIAGCVCIPTALSEVMFHFENGAVYTTPAGSKLPEAPWISIFTTTSDISADQFFRECGWFFEPQYFSHRKPWVLRDR